MPKTAVDVSKQEVMRSVRITNTQKLEVLAMRIPSKVGGFNQEYYPPFNANEASSSAEAWCAGNDVPAKTMQLSAAAKTVKKKQPGLSKLGKGAGLAPAASAVAEETKGGSSGDAAALHAQIAQLQKDLAVAQAAGAGGDAAPEDLTTCPKLGYWKIRGLGAPIRYMFY